MLIFHNIYMHAQPLLCVRDGEAVCLMLLVLIVFLFVPCVVFIV